MNFFKSKKKTNDDNEERRTTSAQTSTTNTTVTTNTLIDRTTNRITYQTTTQRVDHQETAHVVEIVRRLEVSESDLKNEHLLQKWKMEGCPKEIMSQDETATQKTGSKFSSHVESRNFNVNQKSSGSFSSTSLFDQGSSTRFPEGRMLALTGPAAELSNGSKPSSTVSTILNNFGLQRPNLDAQMVTPPKTGAIKKSTSASSTTTTTTSASKPVTSSMLRTSSSNSSPITTSMTYESPYKSNTSLNYKTPYAMTQLTKTPSLPASPVPKRNPKKLLPAKAYIFNHESYKSPVDTPRRVGTQHDVDALKKLFKSLKVDVKVENDRTLAQIEATMSNLKEKNFNKISAVVIVIMTHGNRHEILSAFDKEYCLHDTIELPLIDNPTLADKPKILLISACKGNRESSAVQADAKRFGKPTELVKFYSTFEGYASYRVPQMGTFFIQTFCEIMTEHAKTKDIKTIMQMVQQRMRDERREQVPVYTSSLLQSYIFGDYC